MKLVLFCWLGFVFGSGKVGFFHFWVLSLFFLVLVVVILQFFNFNSDEIFCLVLISVNLIFLKKI